MIAQSTICAPATSGQGAIAVIRLSGPESHSIASKLFHSKDESKKLEEQPGNTIHFGTIEFKDEVVDEVLLSLFRAPQSYTGEDSIEISCHASPYIQKRIMEALLDVGAEPARPGEFTQRAFLNGKMDLSQAEAVADLISAESEGAHRVALKQLRGGFSEELKALRAQLLHFISLMELELDFSEEDVEFANREQLTELLGAILVHIENLMKSFSLGNVLKNGVPVAIIGRPNVGKSTLLNALLNEERAIVSDIEGTTRDSIEDSINLDGIVFRFIDTAGIRETADTIENLGIRRTYQKVEEASMVLLLAEAGDDAELIQRSLDALREQIKGSGKELILVLNKSDRVESTRPETMKKQLKPAKHEHILAISAETGENMDQLKELLKSLLQTGSAKHQDVLISNIRHYNALKAASESLTRAIEGFKTGLPTDLLAQDIREVIHHVGEITGEVSTDEVLGNIFRNFCIGK